MTTYERVMRGCGDGMTTEQRQMVAARTLQQWFEFYRQRSCGGLAYFFAREKYLGYRGADYKVPDFLWVRA